MVNRVMGPHHHHIVVQKKKKGIKQAVSVTFYLQLIFSFFLPFYTLPLNTDTSTTNTNTHISFFYLFLVL